MLLSSNIHIPKGFNAKFIYIFIEFIVIGIFPTPVSEFFFLIELEYTYFFLSFKFIDLTMFREEN